MRVVLGILLGLVIVGLGGGLLALGAFPPKPVQHPVHQVLSTDRPTP